MNIRDLWTKVLRITETPTCIQIELYNKNRLEQYWGTLWKQLDLTYMCVPSSFTSCWITWSKLSSGSSLATGMLAVPDRVSLWDDVCRSVWKGIYWIIASFSSSCRIVLGRWQWLSDSVQLKETYCGTRAKTKATHLNHNIFHWLVTIIMNTDITWKYFT